MRKLFSFSTMMVILFLSMTGYAFKKEFFTKQEIPKEITITLPTEAWDVVVKALSKLPYEESANIIPAIYQQARRQIDAAAKADSIKQKH